jgi:drug/metabolite transporter (DMT)-like permease
MTVLSRATEPEAPALRAFGALFVGATLIGLSSMFFRLSAADPAAAGMWRMVFALPLLALWTGLERRPRAEGKPVNAEEQRRALAVAGLGGLAFAVDMVLTNIALQNTTIASAIILVHLAPVFVVAAAWLLFREPPSGRIIAALALAIAGAALLVQSGRTGGSARSLMGDLAAIAAAVFYAGYILAIREARRSIPTGLATLFSAAVCGVACLGFALLLGERLLPATLFGLAMLAAMGVICHAVGQGLSAYASGTLSASITSIVLVYGVLVTVLSAWIAFGEVPTLVQAIGGAAVLGAVLLCRPK